MTQIKQQLRQIYEDLSGGKLSQDAALGRIRALKLQDRGDVATLLAVPAWEASGVATAFETRDAGYSEHHVILCELSNVNTRTLTSLLPDSDSLSLLAAPHHDIAQRY